MALKEILSNQTEVSELFKEITLTQEEEAQVLRPDMTEEEKTTALFLLRQKKAGQIQVRDYMARLRKVSLVDPLTAEQQFEKIKNLGWFNLDGTNDEIVWNLCLYFTGDVRSPCEAKKGLFLYGPVGCGKTTLISLFRLNQVCSFSIVTCRQISYDFQRYGYDPVHRFKWPGKFPEAKQLYGQEETGYCFDDLGTEVDKKFYGNESNVMAEILLDRYEKASLKGKTHITTNLNTTMLEERYGYRVRSRIREMFNIVIFEDKSPDRRK